jgi:hypothetical protein
LPFVENLVAWMTANRAKILSYAWIPQALLGLFLLGLAHFMGSHQRQLIFHGVKTQGTIVAYKTELFRGSSNSSFTSTAYMPIVEFRAGDHVVRFQDWLGSSSQGGTHTPVAVLYDPANPAIAMIDRPVWNWLPWAPINLVGLFLLFVAAKGLLFRPKRAD